MSDTTMVSADPALAVRPMPVGCRFHPTDQELVGHYLRHKLEADDLSIDDTIPEIGACKYEPWDLLALATSASATKFDEFHCYFFSPRDLKYNNSKRSNRATPRGCWKVTGKDREIINKDTNKVIGTKKTLVYYERRGNRTFITDWVIHEYHAHQQGSHVLCWLRKKNEKKTKEKVHQLVDDETTIMGEHENQVNTYMIQRTSQRSTIAVDSVEQIPSQRSTIMVDSVEQIPSQRSTIAVDSVEQIPFQWSTIVVDSVEQIPSQRSTIAVDLVKQKPFQQSTVDSVEQIPSQRSTIAVDSEEQIPSQRSTIAVDSEEQIPSQRSTIAVDSVEQIPSQRSTIAVDSEEQIPSQRSTIAVDSEEQIPSQRSTIAVDSVEQIPSQRSTIAVDLEEQIPSQRSTITVDSEEQIPSQRSTIAVDSVDQTNETSTSSPLEPNSTKVVDSHIKPDETFLPSEPNSNIEISFDTSKFGFSLSDLGESCFSLCDFGESGFSLWDQGGFTSPLQSPRTDVAISDMLWHEG